MAEPPMPSTTTRSTFQYDEGSLKARARSQASRH